MKCIALVIAACIAAVSCQGQAKAPQGPGQASPQHLQRQPQPRPEQEQQARQLLLIAERQQFPQQQFPQQQFPQQQLQQQQYANDLQFAFFNPQLEIPTFNYIPDKQPFPRVQPQVLLYPGAAGPGQPFLLQPGSPPGNFLYPQPQPGPNVFIRGGVPPQRPPVFVAGYPKPAHIPPIEKDAEEIPTNPAKIPPFPTTPKKKRPEKLETFDENDDARSPEGEATEAAGLAGGDNKQQPFAPPSQVPTINNLRPGQRFFVLNGIPIFSNYPFASNNPEFNVKYTEPNPLPVIPQFTPPSSRPGFSQIKPDETNFQLPLRNPLFQEGQFGESPSNSFDNQPGLEPKSTQNFIGFSQPENFKQENVFRSVLPLSVEGKEQETVQLKFGDKDFKLRPIKLYNSDLEDAGYFQYQADGLQDDDSVVIEASGRNNDEENSASNSEASPKVPENPSEHSISQAHPGAIALAGPGGTASAGPRGTALVGPQGLAVSSPQATAVAGPTRDQIKPDENKKQESNKTRKAKKQQ